VVAIRSSDSHAQRCAALVGQHVTLGAACASVGRVGAGFIAPQRGFRARTVNRLPTPVDAAQPIIVAKQHLPDLQTEPCLEPRLDSADARSSRCQTGLPSLSTARPLSTRRGCLQASPAKECCHDRPCPVVSLAVAALASCSTAHPECAIVLTGWSWLPLLCCCLTTKPTASMHHPLILG
jgi:hypothetical protein